MKFKQLLILFSVFLFYLIFQTSLTANEPPKNLDKLLFNSAQGREFWFAIPPNEDDRQPLGNTGPKALDIYVTSSKNCNVTIEYPGTGYKMTKKVEAFKITTFTSANNETQWTWEVRESEKALDMGVHIIADQPVSVYVLNHRNVTSDGFLAIPTSACGTDYIHLAYYDFYENLTGGEYRGAGFLAIATEDETQLKISLKGKGKSLATTLGGHTIGDYWTVNLKKGQVYPVMGKGNTRGQWDISGTRVTSNKPIGFISFHKRTLIPSYDLYNGRNCLMEMIPPVTAWGKKYSTVEYKRRNRGDFFRIICSEDNTKWSCKWYDPSSGALLGQTGGILSKSGDFAEYLEAYVLQGQPNTFESIRGTSVWVADKPVLVIQYSYSTEWDNAPEFDPFMILVVPVEQFIPGTVFQTPDEQAGFNSNFFNIVAIGDTNDPVQTKLRSIKLDGTPIYQLESKFTLNRIPTTNLYWAKLAVKPGSHRVTGDTKFGGYIYGFSDADGYGWPAAMAINKVDETDTLPPEYKITGTCGDFSITTTEVRNSTNPNDNPRQIDQGLSIIELLEGSFNYDLVFPTTFTTYPKNTKYTFELHVVDKKKDAVAIFQITDRAGNSSVDSVKYYAPKFILEPDSVVNFGNVRVKTTKEKVVVLRNLTDTSVVVKEVKLANGKYYTITDGGNTPFTLAARGFAGDTHQIRIAYTPLVEGLTPNDKDYDSLLVKTECADYKWQLQGRGVLPHIYVEDWEAGTIVKGTSVCLDNGLRVENRGTDTLYIYNIKNVAAPFELSSPTIPPLPIIIPPGGTIFLKTICFKPTVIGDYTIDVSFFSNTGEPCDSVSNWHGKAIMAGPQILGNNWHLRRQATLKELKVYVWNTGNAPIKITDLKIGGSPSDYSIKQGSIKPDINAGAVTLYKDKSGNPNADTIMEATVIFEPGKVGPINDSIVAEYQVVNSSEKGLISDRLLGIGYLPQIEATPYEFFTPILVNTAYPTNGNVIIKATATTNDTTMFVEQIRFKAGTNTNNEFSWVTPPPTNFTMRKDETLSLPVKFNGSKVVGDPKAIVEIVSDAEKGPQEDPRIITETYVLGHVFDQGLVVTNIDFGSRMLCDTPIDSFMVELAGPTTRIDSIVSLSGNLSVFELMDKAGFPMNVQSGVKTFFKVKFKPNAIGSFYDSLIVYTNIGKDVAYLKGIGYTDTVNVSLKKYSVNDNLTPGMSNQPLPVTFTNNNWSDCKMTEFTVVIGYESKRMRFNKVFKGSILDDSWNIVQQKEVNYSNGMTQLFLTARGTTPISRDGDVLVPKFLLLLSDKKEFTPTVDSATSISRDACVKFTRDPGYVVMNSCEIGIRAANISGVPYQLHDIVPNPVSDKSVTITYDVAFDDIYTKIEIYNAQGQMVKVVTDGPKKQKAGWTENVSTEDLSSGVYSVKFTCGSYTEVKPLVIVK